MEFHEAANIFPLDEDHIADLARDIRANGQQVPIELLGGKIIDGRRRFKACELAGVKPRYRTVDASEVSDPIAYVLSLNLYRRHLNPSQLAMVGQKAREIYDRQAKDRQLYGQQSGGRGHKKNSVEILPPSLSIDPGKARDAAGKAVGVSGKLIDSAKRVIEEGVPELARAVEEGRLSVSSAAKLTPESEEVQREVANESKFSGGRYRKPEVKAKDESEPEDNRSIRPRGVGTDLAYEAVNCLTRIPKNDPLRKRGLQIVTDWIKRNP